VDLGVSGLASGLAGGVISLKVRHFYLCQVSSLEGVLELVDAVRARHVSFHRSYKGPRAVHSRIIQTILGHSFCGEYYARFVPSEPTSCLCVCSRDDILSEGMYA